MMTASRLLCGAAALMIGLATVGGRAQADSPVHDDIPPVSAERTQHPPQRDPIHDRAHDPAHDSATENQDRARCLSRCGAQEARCSSEVRRARSECSRRASTAGREPFGRVGDYAYFCRYFGDADRHCAFGGTDCQARFTRRHGLCLETMSDNVAALRYDCIKSERNAQGFCREELRDCRVACE